MCYMGMVFAVISGGHYTIDVLIAYWLASHVFWSYHQIFEQPAAARRRQPITNLWWYYACCWFEAGVPDGRLHNDVAWPFYKPVWCRRRWRCCRKTADCSTAVELGGAANNGVDSK